MWDHHLLTRPVHLWWYKAYVFAWNIDDETIGAAATCEVFSPYDGRHMHLFHEKYAGDHDGYSELGFQALFDGLASGFVIVPDLDEEYPQTR
jgi:hypothetical protein